MIKTYRTKRGAVRFMEALTRVHGLLFCVVPSPDSFGFSVAHEYKPGALSYVRAPNREFWRRARALQKRA